jgi:hypothetical protein
MVRQRTALLAALARLKSWEWAPTRALAEETRHPAKTTLELLEDAWLVGLVERDVKVKAGEETDGQGEGGDAARGRPGYAWRLAEGTREDIETTGLFADLPPF